MLLKLNIEGKQFFPSQIKGKWALEKNVIIIIRTQARILYVDYIDSTNLGAYSPPIFLSGKIFFYEIIEVPEDYLQYIKCIAREIENRLNPLYKNKKLKCNGDVTVVVE